MAVRARRKAEVLLNDERGTKENPRFENNSKIQGL